MKNKCNGSLATLVIAREAKLIKRILDNLEKQVLRASGGIQKQDLGENHDPCESNVCSNCRPAETTI